MNSLTIKVLPFLVILSSLQFLVASQSAVCSDKCTDYHRLCPGINSAEFYNKYLLDVKNGVVENFRKETLVKPDCGTAVYAYVCPYSCGKCTPCYVSQIAAAQTEISSLESQVTTLVDSVKQLSDAVTILLTLPIKGATSSLEYNNNYVLTKSYDGGLETQIDACFHSKPNKNAWAEYEIPSSKVLSVGILNRKSAPSAKRLKGSRVEVCTLRGGCSQLCGVFADVPASSWGYVDCPAGGVEGSYVRIENPDNFLQICEMEIKGKVIGTSTSKSAVIVSATSSWRYSSSMVVAKSHDGGLKTHINNCFHSKDKHNGWAEYQIELSTVRAVGVLNRQSLAAVRLKGSQVQVCQQTGGCSDICGTFEDVPASSWGYVHCPGAGIRGSYIRIINPADFLQICEVDIQLA